MTTKWKYTDATERVVSRTNANGSSESCLVEAIADWLAEGNTPDPVDIPTPQEQFAILEAALDNHLNTAAHDKRYNDRFTFALRAGYPSPFQAEAIVFATWMDNCNTQSYAAAEEVKAGTRPMPTVEEFIAALPVLVYP